MNFKQHFTEKLQQIEKDQYFDQFEIDGLKYGVFATRNPFYLHKGFVNSKIEQTEEPDSWDFQFVLDDDEYDSFDVTRTTGDAGYKAIKVFKIVERLFKDFVEEINPIEVTFSANSDEIKRAGLYDRLATKAEKITKGKYIYIPHPNISDWIDVDISIEFVSRGHTYVIVRRDEL